MNPLPADTAPRILHDDGALLVLDKPAGLPTVPYRLGDRTHCLRAWAEAALGKRLFVIHRLDKETSGVIAFAHDADTHRRVSREFEHRQVVKVYLAAVAGHVPAPEFTIDAPLREFGSGRVAVDARGKASRTHCRLRERLRGCDLLEVDLLTGRRHQIRVHLFQHGHPVLGDPLYGVERPVGGAQRLLLHAWRLVLPGHAGRPAPLEIEAPPPPDFAAELAQRR
jgi:RluA family pseudouridine synthase